jgi:hypothetical protein
MTKSMPTKTSVGMTIHGGVLTWAPVAGSVSGLTNITKKLKAKKMPADAKMIAPTASPRRLPSRRP